MSKVVRVSGLTVDIIKKLQDYIDYGEKLSEADFLEIAVIEFATKRGIDIHKEEK